MGFLSSDRYDVFCSYGRDDNERGRVKEFHDTLREWLMPGLRNLKRRYPDLSSLDLEKSADFFWDETCFPVTGEPTDRLKREVQKSEFLFLFVGPGYLGSGWCFNEIEFFLEAHKSEPEEEVWKRLFIFVLDEESKKADWKWTAKSGQKPIFHELYDGDGPIKRRRQGFEDDRYTRLLDRVIEGIAKCSVDIIRHGGGSVPADRQDAQPAPPPRSGVTVGIVTPDLKEAQAELVAHLNACKIDVRELDPDTVTDADPAHPPKEITDAINRSLAFVQPYSFHRVRIPYFGPGGHLGLQQKLVGEGVPTLWLKLDRGIALSEVRETDTHHLKYLQSIKPSATDFRDLPGLVPVLANGGSHSKRKRREILVESSAKDEKILDSLIDRLDQLWKDEYRDIPRPIYKPLPLPSLLGMGDDLVENAGVLFLFGNKDEIALLRQVSKIYEMIEECKDKKGLGDASVLIAVAVVHPKLWDGPIGSRYSFPFGVEPDDEFKRLGLRFLTAIRKYMDSDVGTGGN
ncbi:MAG: hypothetical protein IPK78_20425 [Rhodospirillales bacterium]|nr:hypothetical protein [Rhodospirillales bacterium]